MWRILLLMIEKGLLIALIKLKQFQPTLRQIVQPLHVWKDAVNKTLKNAGYLEEQK